MTAKIKKIFIANRGEIARRIAESSKKLGIATVAISARNTPPAYLFDLVTEFVHVPDESTKTYLDAQLIISLAQSHGCDAIHPGFGFLSENPDFASSVIKAGLTWIGPRPGAIDAMASKATAREHAQKAKVPCLPGINGINLESGGAAATQELERFAAQHGLPVLMKAAFGGGGKGMRIVEKLEDLLTNAQRASAEAHSSFGNPSLIVEKYLPAPRHVEVQVLADKHGNVCILGDRDCSLQRRHQKILEEAPAPDLPSNIRASMHAAASSLASAVGYDNAGTVEFLVDETNASNVSFYFLEMNTRLQVEHTVTEEIYGIDLVEWQIRVARGETLPPEFSTLKPRGHSIEVRIYAEDPGNNFFPAPGSVRAFVPAAGRGIRWELGIDTVDEISDKFDPMIAKLVCSAGDRRQALELVAETLERTLFAGPRNNIQFLTWLVRHPKITARPVDTHFIAKNVNHALDWESSKRTELEPMVNHLLNRLEAGSLAGFEASTTSAAHTTIPVITESSFSLRNIHATAARQTSSEEIQIIAGQIAWSPQDPRASCRYGFGRRLVEGQKDVSFSFVIYKAPSRFEYWIGSSGHNWVRIDERKTIASSGANAGTLDGMTAPVPGKVIQVSITGGDVITKGQTLFVLESMKMQFEVKASLDGRAGSILVKTGQQVSAGQQLAQWASEQ